MTDEPEKNDQQDDRESKEFTEDNDVQIDTTIIGDCALVINGDVVDGNPDSKNKVRMKLEIEGDVLVTLNGEDYQHFEDGGQD